MAWSLAAAGISVLLVEICARVLVGRAPEQALRSLTGVYRVCLLILTPVVAVLTPLLPAQAVQRRDEPDEEDATEQEIEAFIRMGEREGILEPDEEHLVRGIVDFGDTEVRSVMTPRIDVVSADVESPLQELSTVFLDSNHSRLPLYHDSEDEIVGILHIRDLLRGLRSKPPMAASELCKSPYFVPESQLLDDVLPHSRRRGCSKSVDADRGKRVFQNTQLAEFGPLMLARL